MSYPPKWRVVTDTGAAAALMRAHPFAHFVTSHAGIFSTRIPVIADLEADETVRLRGHLNAQNPQADSLDGHTALVTFDGPASYVSPNWRVDLSRAGTYDYEEVQVRGEIKIVEDIGAFRKLIDDLAALIEQQHAEIGDYPLWRTSMSPPGYIERLHPAIVAFEVRVASVHMTSKLHQSFPEADRRSVADHLARSAREESRAIAEKIRRTLD